MLARRLLRPSGAIIAPAVMWGHANAPLATGYPIVDGSSFGTKYDNPSPVLPGLVRGVAFSPDGKYVAFGHDNTPFITVYEWTDDGFGAKINAPASLLQGNAWKVAWSPDQKFIAIATTVNPFLHVYAWNNPGFGSPQLRDPEAVLLPTLVGSAVCPKWSPDGRFLAITHSTTPFITVYNWDNGFGTKVDDPATLPLNNAFALDWSPDGLYLAVTNSTTSPYIQVYNWTGTGFGTKVGSNPSTLPTSVGYGVTFSPDSKFIVLANSGTIPLQAYAWSAAGFGTRYTPASGIAGSGIDVKFNKAGTLLAVGSSTSPYHQIYNWSSSGFGTKFASADTQPTGSCWDVDFTPYE